MSPTVPLCGPISAELVRLYADYLYDEYGSLGSDYVFVNLWVARRAPMTRTRSQCAALAGFSARFGDRRRQSNDSAQITGQEMHADAGVMSGLSVNMYNTITRSKGG